MFNEKIRTQILSGSLQNMNGYLTGCYNGYYVVVQDRRSQYVITINANDYEDLANEKLAEFVKKLKEEQERLSETEVGENFVKLVIALPYVEESIPEVVNGILNPVMDYLIKGGYMSNCKECGEPVSLFDYHQVNGSGCYICSDCAKKYEKSNDNRQQQYNQQVPNQSGYTQQAVIREKSNLLTGIIGAILGSLPGAGLWILIGKFGYIAGIVGLLIGLGTLFGYKFLGRGIDRKGVVFTVIWLMLVVYVSNYIGVTWSVYDALAEYGFTFKEIFASLYDLLEMAEAKGEYIWSLVIGYVFTFGSIGKTFIEVFRSSN